MSYYNTLDPKILMMHASRIGKKRKEGVSATDIKSHLTQAARDDPRHAELADWERNRRNSTGTGFSNREGRFSGTNQRSLLRASSRAATIGLSGLHNQEFAEQFKGYRHKYLPY
jgi:hypothetical protein